MDINKLTDKMKMLAFTTSDEGSKGLHALCNRPDSPLPSNATDYVLREYIYFKAFLVSFYVFYKFGMNYWDTINPPYLSKLGNAFSHDIAGYGNNYDELLSRYNHYWEVAMSVIKSQSNSNPDVNKLMERMCSDYMTITGVDLFNHVRVYLTSFEFVVFYHSYEWIKKEIDNFDKPDSKCFVATATYQDIMHPNVVLLRDYRDRFLRKSFFGRLFIALYYKVGPYLAYFPENSKCIRKMSKNIIDNIVLKIKSKYY